MDVQAERVVTDPALLLQHDRLVRERPSAAAELLRQAQPEDPGLPRLEPGLAVDLVLGGEPLRMWHDLSGEERPGQGREVLKVLGQPW